MSKIKVLRIMHRMSISGPTHHAAYLTKYLGDKYETMLLSGMIESGERDGSFIMEQIGVEPVYISDMERSINLIKDRKAYLKIREIIKNYQPDIVHTHAAKSGALGRLAAIHEKVPVIIHTYHGHVFHSYFGKLKTFIFLTIERFLAKKSTRIIAISNKQKEELSKDFTIAPPSKISVIKLGFDLSKFVDVDGRKRNKFRSEFQLDDSKIAFGIIGRVTGVKNHHHFLKSFALHKTQSNANSIAFVIGDGDLMNEIKDLCSELGLNISTPQNKSTQPNVIFTSWREDVEFVMNGLDVVCLTSLNEGTPVSLIEAQAAQKPILTTNVGGVEDIVIKDKSALLYKVNDVDGLAIGMTKLAENPDKRLEMASYANSVREEFSYKRLVKDIDGLYQKLMDGKSK
ncbi:MAG: glycosyltransferase [Saprospiraceae bacterium]|nr:glycosyltransferase [Saprospiraceae bacterium]